jgi:hypothetical protein
MPGKQSKTLAMQSVSQIPGLSGAIGRDGFLCKGIKFAVTRITFNGRIEPIGVKRFKPGTKPRQLRWSQLLDGLFNVFGSCHPGNITP